MNGSQHSPAVRVGGDEYEQRLCLDERQRSLLVQSDGHELVF